MKKIVLFVISVIGVVSVVVSCKKGKEETVKETMISGNVTILVDESIFPIMEDQKDVFQNTYNANITLNPQSETEVINSLIEDKARVGILTRMLRGEEESTLGINVTPKITKFALDAVVFIVNKKEQDSVIELDEVYAYLNGNDSHIKSLVFDNPNSSVTRNIFEKLNINKDNINVYSKGTSEELIKFIAENEGHIGVLGINWLTQTPTKLLKHSENVKILSVKNVKKDNSDNQYIYPSQANIGKKTYPLTRELFLLNYQGTTGLGMGFASFVASDIGQKIILTSGLAPVKLEPMNINIKKDIN